MTLILAPETEARLRAAFKETGLAPEEVIDAALEALRKSGSAPAKAIRSPVSQAPNQAPVQDTPEQARMRAALFEVTAQAQALVPAPRPQNPEQASEERSFGEIVTEKYRRQGFHLP